MPHCEASIHDTLLAANWESLAQPRREARLSSSPTARSSRRRSSPSSTSATSTPSSNVRPKMISSSVMMPTTLPCLLHLVLGLGNKFLSNIREVDSILQFSLLRKKQRGQDWKKFKDLADHEKEAIQHLCLLTMKPVIYVANVTESDLAQPDSNPHVKEVPSDVFLMKKKRDSDA